MVSVTVTVGERRRPGVWQGCSTTTFPPAPVCVTTNTSGPSVWPGGAAGNQPPAPVTVDQTPGHSVPRDTSTTTSLPAPVSWSTPRRTSPTSSPSYSPPSSSSSVWGRLLLYSTSQSESHNNSLKKSDIFVPASWKLYLLSILLFLFLPSIYFMVRSIEGRKDSFE